MGLTFETEKILNERFGHDTLIALATSCDNIPYVRAVNSYYENSCFYVITYALSNKMLHIKENPNVSICGDWFTAHGIGENIGSPLDEHNTEIMHKLRDAFASWYNNGHVNESDPNTCILRIQLTCGVLMDHGTRYDIDFTE